MFGKFEKGNVLFAHAIENADGADLFVGKANDLAARAAELHLERLDALGRCVKMLLEELFENVHEYDFQPFRFGESAKPTPF